MDAPSDELQAAYAFSSLAIAQYLKVDVQTGLTSSDVAIRRTSWGWNELATAKPPSIWLKVLTQFNNLVIWILLAAALISGITGDWIDVIAILAIVLLNALLGFYQEEKADQAIAGLKKMIVHSTKCIRDGTLRTVDSRELLPGDVIQLEAGDHVPADARLLYVAGLAAQEAALTGESASVLKDEQAILSTDTLLPDRRNMIYMGTSVVAGMARAIVVATGMQTEVGRIAGLMESGDKHLTPLQMELKAVGRTLTLFCLALVAVIFWLRVWRGDSFLQGLMAAMTLAVAAVPEGLPAVVTVTLTIGLQRMVLRNVLIRKLSSVETLGCVTVICSDKTGTLTQNAMTVREIDVCDQAYDVTGSGYEPVGEFIPQIRSSDGTASVQPDLQSLPETLKKMLWIGAVCNHAKLIASDETWRIVGDPMEAALVVAAQKSEDLRAIACPQIVCELPFDSERKMMSVQIRESNGSLQQLTKGAPEVLLSRSIAEMTDSGIEPITEIRRERLLLKANEMASRGLRVLGFALRNQSKNNCIDESNLIFCGFAGILDPPRKGVFAAIVRCRDAGIRTVIITGDHPITARRIGEDLGILSRHNRLLSGTDLDLMSDQQLAAVVTSVGGFARVSPVHKLRIVHALQSTGQVVAMTGDGVNDAPAIQAADIGIAMGQAGTDVTREAASMVLIDDNFNSIVMAVEQGRAIYDNISKFLVYLLSCNIGEMLLMLIAALLGWPSPLLPLQLLWINLVTDGFPALALALEPAESDLMKRLPRAADHRLLNLKLGADVFCQGVLLAGIGILAFWVGMKWTDNVDHARTLVFNAIVFSELIRAFASRSRRQPVWEIGLISNPHLFAAIASSMLLQVVLMNWSLTRSVFDVTGLAAAEWGALAVLSLIPFGVLECFKLVSRRRVRQPDSPEIDRLVHDLNIDGQQKSARI